MTWAEGTGYMPTRKSVLDTDEGKAFLEKKPAFQAILDNLDEINPRIQHKAGSACYDLEELHGRGYDGRRRCSVRNGADGRRDQRCTW